MTFILAIHTSNASFHFVLCTMSTYLGQNFLKDSKIISFITQKISDLYEQQQCDTIIEIGPWKWAITKKIKNIGKQFFVIEKDPKMVACLLEKDILQEEQIIHQDVLEANVFSLLHTHGIRPENALIVGNLPYYITSPIVRKFFGNEQSQYGWGFFMMQREVGDKIKQDAPKKSYLWRLCNFAHEVHYSKTVPAKAFSPAPKVQSCLLSFVPKHSASGSREQFATLVSLLDHISPYKRKTMGKIRKMLEKKWISVCPLFPHIASKRLEEVTWDDMLLLLQ